MTSPMPTAWAMSFMASADSLDPISIKDIPHWATLPPAVNMK
ncbi:hypothetical protein ZBT109_1375 [Zymobacter palmae]|uniref:Uncharacterized protein n=1 Tax=Zymobacter palmae TaxID=33074 RepID=A0A348HET3_9GAMM|nr:hypothetical protein ZBT109_1375 [Zymobacter palmae]